LKEDARMDPMDGLRMLKERMECLGKENGRGLRKSQMHRMVEKGNDFRGPYPCHNRSSSNHTSRSDCHTAKNNN
jgi:hypothetical protein